jgi:hypothetical protein
VMEEKEESRCVLSSGKGEGEVVGKSFGLEVVSGCVELS